VTDPKITVVVADDSVLLRDGVVRLLEESGFTVLAALSNAEELLHTLTHTTPDLVLVDVRMPPTFTDEGIQAAITIRENSPSQAVVVLSQYVEETYASELLAGDVGGLGYLLKDRVVNIADFVSSLRRVAAGGSAVDAEVVQQILSRSRRTAELARLTPRESQVLGAMAEGLSNGGIGDKLVVSLGAVEKHISNVFTKLDLEPVNSAHRRVLAVLTYMNEQRPG